MLEQQRAVLHLGLQGKSIRKQRHDGAFEVVTIVEPKKRQRLCHQFLHRNRHRDKKAVSSAAFADGPLMLCWCSAVAFRRLFPAGFPIPEADIVMGSKNRRRFAAVEPSGRRRAAGRFFTRWRTLEPMKIGNFHSRTRAFLKIQTVMSGDVY